MFLNLFNKVILLYFFMSDHSFEKYSFKKKSIDHWKYFPSEIDEGSLQQIVGSRLTKIDLAQLICERLK